ncbi:hypothetical protein L218DRAFT_1023922 [Marasmius fiardii PR-910]|nr:hypothetical protein L218DRAFT_1023922 [Marasmius fiardii PR-910]
MDNSQPSESMDSYWLTADDDEVIELLKLLWFSFYDPTEVVLKNIRPEDRFEVVPYNNGNFEVYDRLNTAFMYLVSRAQLCNSEFSVEQVVKAATDEWNAPVAESCSRHIDYQASEPDGEYPALTWLYQTVTQALILLIPESQHLVHNLVKVWPCEGGYLICDDIDGTDYFVSHEQVKSSTFSIDAVIANGPMDDPPPLVSLPAR